jgi:hypothetical protein
MPLLKCSHFFIMKTETFHFQGKPIYTWDFAFVNMPVSITIVNNFFMVNFLVFKKENFYGKDYCILFKNFANTCFHKGKNVK